MPHTTPKRPTSHAGGSLQRFLRDRGRMVHKSCDARMVPNPFAKHGPWSPWVQKPGLTYKIGSNKLKREIRAIRKMHTVSRQRALDLHQQVEEVLQAMGVK